MIQLRSILSYKVSPTLLYIRSNVLSPDCQNITHVSTDIRTFITLNYLVYNVGVYDNVTCHYPQFSMFDLLRPMHKSLLGSYYNASLGFHYSSPFYLPSFLVLARKVSHNYKCSLEQFSSVSSVRQQLALSAIFNLLNVSLLDLDSATQELCQCNLCER